LILFLQFYAQTYKSHSGSSLAKNIQQNEVKELNDKKKQ
jgi:hypothetical protein